MGIKQVWEFKNEIKSLEETNGVLKVLDLGCQFGNVFFHLYHEFEIKNYLGIEKESFENIKSESTGHFDYNGLLTEGLLENDINDYLLNFNETKSQERLYGYYKITFDKVIKKHAIYKELDKKSFYNIYSNKNHFQFNKTTEEYLESCENEKFDIIVMSKILHYKDIKNHEGLIKSAFELLNENGILYIQNRKVDESEKKRNLNYEKFKEIVIEYFEIIESLEKDQLSYFLLRKN